MSICKEIYEALVKGVYEKVYSGDFKEIENVSLSPTGYNEMRADEKSARYLSFHPRPMFINIMPIVINHKQTERFILNSKVTRQE